MFYCSQRRVQWYLSRNLAEVLSEDPLEIKLNFKTKGPGNRGDAFYLQSRENICVVCGVEKDLTRHHVVPFSFRRWFPDAIKNHSYHDILILCAKCHDEYEDHSGTFRKQLAQEYDAPTNGIFDRTQRSNVHVSVMYARTLKKHAEQIPEDRRKYLIGYIEKTWNENKFTDVFDMEAIAALKTESGVCIATQGQIVVSKLNSIHDFECRWRAHFIDKMRPKFLPEHWSVERDTR